MIKSVENKNSFKVPEGYFDNLTERIMANIPEETTAAQKEPKRIMLTPVMRWAALILCVFTFSSIALLHRINNDQPTAALPAQENYEQGDELIKAADYAMLDRNDIYDLCYED